MSHALPVRPTKLEFQVAFPLLALLNPRRYTTWVIVSLVAGLAVSYLAMTYGGLPLWGATAIVLAGLVPVGIFKWRDDRLLYGTTAMVLSILVTAQGAHTIEHLVQWVQYHVLFWTTRQSNGLLSPANAEWVHFHLELVGADCCDPFAAAAVCATSGPGCFLLSLELTRSSIPIPSSATRWFSANSRQWMCSTSPHKGCRVSSGATAGWRGSEWTRGTFFCTIPGLTTAIRLDVHFWWNALETTLMLVAGHVFLRSLPPFARRDDAG